MHTTPQLDRLMELSSGSVNALIDQEPGFRDVTFISQSLKLRERVHADDRISEEDEPLAGRRVAQLELDVATSQGVKEEPAVDGEPGVYVNQELDDAATGIEDEPIENEPVDEPVDEPVEDETVEEYQPRPPPGPPPPGPITVPPPPPPSTRFPSALWDLSRATASSSSSSQMNVMLPPAASPPIGSAERVRQQRRAWASKEMRDNPGMGAARRRREDYSR